MQYLLLIDDREDERWNATPAERDARMPGARRGTIEVHSIVARER